MLRLLRMLFLVLFHSLARLNWARKVKLDVPPRQSPVEKSTSRAPVMLDVSILWCHMSAFGFGDGGG